MGEGMQPELPFTVDQPIEERPVLTPDQIMARVERLEPKIVTYELNGRTVSQQRIYETDNRGKKHQIRRREVGKLFDAYMEGLNQNTTSVEDVPAAAESVQLPIESTGASVIARPGLESTAAKPKRADASNLLQILLNDIDVAAAEVEEQEGELSFRTSTPSFKTHLARAHRSLSESEKAALGTKAESAPIHILDARPVSAESGGVSAPIHATSTTIEHPMPRAVINAPTAAEKAAVSPGSETLDAAGKELAYARAALTDAMASADEARTAMLKDPTKTAAYFQAVNGVLTKCDRLAMLEGWDDAHTDKWFGNLTQKYPEALVVLPEEADRDASEPVQPAADAKPLHSVTINAPTAAESMVLTPESTAAERTRWKSGVIRRSLRVAMLEAKAARRDMLDMPADPAKANEYRKSINRVFARFETLEQLESWDADTTTARLNDLIERFPEINKQDGFTEAKWDLKDERELKRDLTGLVNEFRKARFSGRKEDAAELAIEIQMALKAAKLDGADKGYLDSLHATIGQKTNPKTMKMTRAEKRAHQRAKSPKAAKHVAAAASSGDKKAAEADRKTVSAAATDATIPVAVAMDAERGEKPRPPRARRLMAAASALALTGVLYAAGQHDSDTAGRTAAPAGSEETIPDATTTSTSTAPAAESPASSIPQAESQPSGKTITLAEGDTIWDRVYAHFAETGNTNPGLGEVIEMKNRYLLENGLDEESAKVLEPGTVLKVPR